MIRKEEKKSRFKQLQFAISIIPFGIIITAAIVSIVLLQPSGTAEALQNGVAAPDFKLLDAETGNTITKQTFNGKLLFIFFTTTWCTPCQIGAENLAKYDDETGGSALNVLIVFVDDKETADGRFYGWPDFFGNAQPVTDAIFQSPRGGGKPLEYLMQNHPPVEKPLIEPGIGAALAQIDFSRSSSKNNNNNTDKFGLRDMAFIAEFGIMAPITHLPGSIKNQEERGIVGQKVAMLNPQTKNYSDFISLPETIMPLPFFKTLKDLLYVSPPTVSKTES